jgi:ankyrin repeat protein
MEASLHGHAEVVTLLLTNGANVNAADNVRHSLKDSSLTLARQQVMFHSFEFANAPITPNFNSVEGQRSLRAALMALHTQL